MFFWLQAFWKTVLWPFFSYEFIRFVEQNCFFNESVVFLASGILEDGSVAFFHMNLQNCVFSMKVLVFLASGILEDSSVAFFHMNL